MGVQRGSAGVLTPLRNASELVRAGDAAGVETSLDFLGADPYCFRSGYMKAELMHRLANGPILTGVDKAEAQARRHAARPTA